jgi:hypothetical protein
VELRQWIEREAGKRDGERLGVHGVKPVADKLGENPRTVYAWYRMERAPSYPAALNIVIVSRAEVDFNGIFGPYSRRGHGAEEGRL